MWVIQYLNQNDNKQLRKVKEQVDQTQSFLDPQVQANLSTLIALLSKVPAQFQVSGQHQQGFHHHHWPPLAQTQTQVTGMAQTGPIHTRSQAGL